MTEQDIEGLIQSLEAEKEEVMRIETHASWVLLTSRWAYKIKKPVDFGFLDFSTLEKREHYCREEVRLNRRLAPEMYRGVVRIERHGDRSSFEADEGGGGELLDFAVKMRRLPPKKQMDHLLSAHEVQYRDVEAIARMLAPFHRDAERIEEAGGVSAYKDRFNDILQEKELFVRMLGEEAGDRVEKAVKASDAFLEGHAELLKARREEGMIRDCHGDLHSGNIFIDEGPVIFDCIEFNPSFRRIDVLDEIAFFCMDLEAHKEDELAAHFLKIYNQAFPVIRKGEEEALFDYFKAYRANVRAKVTALRASQEEGEDAEKEKGRVLLYLELMDRYLDRL